MEELEKYLKSYFNIPSSELTKITGLFEVKHIPKGELILKIGQYCKSLSFVHDGIVRISALANGKDITQWIATEGYFVTDLNSFTFGAPARWNIEIITDATLFSISKNNYDKIADIIPDWTHLEKSFLVHCFTTMENRIFEFLSLSAEERYLSFFHSHKELFNQVSLQYIASMLGMTPETFSRIRKKLIL